MKEELYWILLSKKLAGEASEAELLQLVELLDNNPGLESISEHFVELWYSTPDKRRISQIAQDAYLTHIVRLKAVDPSFQITDESPEEELTFDNTRSTLQKLFSAPKKLAAYSLVLIAICFFGFKFYLNNGSKDELAEFKNMNELTINPGSKSKIILPDGSLVWVNSGSKLRYVSNFSGKLREVYLNGEAYFEVTKNPARPFVVHTSGIDIKVLGTEFNVKAFDIEPTIEATLIKGSIEVSKKDDVQGSKVLLKPHEKLVYKKLLDKNYYTKSDLNKDIIKARPTDLKSLIFIKPISKHIPDSEIVETAWIKNKFVFDEESLDNLALRMERWYNIKITIQDQQLSSYRVSGSFVDETAEQALNELKLLIPFNYKIKNNEFFIMK
jgi:ferric-dicitrate binding protein FerR (iron transport regulator)